MIHQEPNSIALNLMVVRSSAAVAVPQPDTISSDWRERLPLLAGEAITLRELQLSDAPTLLAIPLRSTASRAGSAHPTAAAPAA